MMYTSRSNATKTTIAAAVLLLAAAFTASCGQNLGTDKIAQVTLLKPQGQVGLELPRPASVQKQGQPVTIQLESVGDKDLKISKLELVNTPKRLLYLGEDTEKGCQYDENQTSDPWNAANGSCKKGQYCDDTTNTCHAAAFPETPVSVEKASSVEYEFFLAASPQNVVDCPEATDDVPDQFKENYCGHFRIKTNASTDNDVFSSGNTTFYFQVDQAERRGKIAFMPTTLNFDGVRPGTSKKKQVTVINNGSQTLTIESIRISTLRDVVTVKSTDSMRQNTPIDIPTGESLKFEVTIDIPSSYKLEDIPSQLFINFGNSAKDTDTPVTVKISTGLEQGPVIDLDKRSLAFPGGSAKTVTVKNVGSQILSLNRLTFSKSTLGDKYSYTVKRNGNSTKIEPDDTGSYIIGENLQPDQQLKLQVEFTGNSGGIGEVNIRHNDDVVGGKSSILLLGPNDGGYAAVVPGSVNFNYGTQQASRRVVIRNRGTQPLSLSPSFQSTSGMQDAEPTHFTLKGALAGNNPIPAGGLATGTVEFGGTDGDSRSGLTVNLEGDGVGGDSKISVNVATKPSGAEDLVAKINAISGETITVGQPAVFDMEGSKNNSDTSGDIWYLVDRPDNSTIYPTSGGTEQFKVRPDVPGTYVIGLTLVDGSQEAQATFELTAEAAN